MDKTLRKQLILGAWVLIGGKPFRVEQLTKKKVGYHRYASKNTMQYAQYFEVEPIEIMDPCVSFRARTKEDRFAATILKASHQYVHQWQVGMALNNVEVEIVIEGSL